MIEIIRDYGLYVMIGLLILHIILASLLSREVLVWVPSWKQKFKLLLLIWLVPVKGLKWANQKAQLGWNEERVETYGTSAPEMGLMLIDAIYNPGARHRIETVQEYKVKVAKKNGQQDDLSEIHCQNKNQTT